MTVTLGIALAIVAVLVFILAKTVVKNIKRLAVIALALVILALCWEKGIVNQVEGVVKTAADKGSELVR